MSITQLITLIITITSATIITSCSEQPTPQQQPSLSNEKKLPTYPTSPLPKNIHWQTNNNIKNFGSPNAKTGGTLKLYLTSFPLTLRTVGPDSNNMFRSILLGNQLGLTTIHPNTEQIIPQLATHWAYDKDQKTVYYKLDPQARWSDDTPVTADDYLFALQFMRSKHIFAPWYNNHYTNMITKVTKFDDHTIAITGKTARPKKDLHYMYGLSPKSRRFHQLTPTWVQDTNWKIEPNTGPYQISKIKHGKIIEFTKKPNWWAQNHPYFKHRFNINKIRFKIIRDPQLAFKHFQKGNIDTFNITNPEHWHKKTNSHEFTNGYIDKYWFYNDTPRFSAGIYLNTKDSILKSLQIRKALSHATNIQKILDTILLGDYQRLHNMHTGYGKYTNTNIQARPFDLKKANTLLDQAGWNQKNSQGIRIKNQQLLKINLSYWKEQHTNRLVILKEEAKKAGIELQLQLLEPSAGYKHTMEKKHQAVMLAWSTGFRPAYWQHFHSDNANKPQTNNITNTSNQQLDSLINQYRNATTEKKRIQLAHTIQQKIHDLAIYIPTDYTPYTRAAAWKWIKLPTTPGHKQTTDLFWPFLSGGTLWIEPQIKQQTLTAKKNSTKLQPKVTIDETYRLK